jgi:hypothetical protein
MENMEKEKFSEDWKEAFEDAGVSPSESVWSSIDIKLESEKMKRRVVYYQRLAAASVLFAILLGVWGVQYFSKDKKSLASTEKINTKGNLEKSSTSTPTSKNDAPAGNENKSMEGSIKKLNSYNNENQITEDFPNTKSILSESEATAYTKQSNQISKDQWIAQLKENSIEPTDNLFSQLSSFLSPQLGSNELPLEKKKRELKQMLFESLAELPNSSKNEKTRSEGIWLALGGGAGSYNPGTGSGQTATNTLTSSNAYQNLQSKSASTGSAYSMGITVGKKIADRWVMQTGINYMNQTLAYTSNFATYTASNETKPSLTEYADRSSSLAIPQPYVVTQLYKINSSMEFVSIPLQAGYLLLDRKFGIQLNAGVATDFFLRNTLQDQSGQSSKYSKGSGDDSPYRAINWAGLASTELSYKIAKQYRISLMPGMRYSFQPSLKSPTSGTVSPFVIDLGFRFKYIFK